MYRKTETSITIKVTYPYSGAYGNGLFYAHKDTPQQWASLSGGSWYTENGLYVVYNLDPETDYLFKMVWYQDDGPWEHHELNYMFKTRPVGDAPTLELYNKTDTSITIKAIFPYSGVEGNNIFIGVPGGWASLSETWYTENGYFQVINLEPDTEYSFAMVWYQDGESYWEHKEIIKTFKTDKAIKSTYYNQWNPNFDTTKLDKIYFPTAGDPEDREKSALQHIKEFGCVASSAAMILKNLNALSKDSHMDHRTDTYGKYIPDPFTIMWTNIGYPDVVYDPITKRYNTEEYTHPFNNEKTPAYIILSVVTPEYNYKAERIYLTGKTDQEKAALLTEFLNQHPEGLQVRSSSNGREHTLVFTKSSYIVPTSQLNILEEVKGIELTKEIEIKDYKKEEMLLNSVDPQLASSVYDSYFTVCDPMGGDNVNFTESWTYKNRGGLRTLTYFDYYERK